MTADIDRGRHREGQVQTYGGWRRTRSIGLFGLGPIGTTVVLGCMVVPMLLASVSFTAAVAAALPALAIGAAATVRIEGASIGHILVRRLRWTWGQAHGHTLYRAGGLTDHSRVWDLPGVMAPTQLLSAPDDRGGTFGLVWNRRTGHLTATLCCAAASTWLVDHRDADGWVDNWHSWLASLGYLPTVRAVAVTVDTAPEAGTTLQDGVLSRLAPTAPADTRRLMRELVARSPAVSADIDTRVSITFDPAASPHRHPGVEEFAAEVSRQLSGLESALSSCGVAVLGRARAAELVGVVRTAFDPADRGEVDRALAAVDAREQDALLTWGNAGPAGAHEGWDSYRHDSGTSVSWGWHEAPRQQVTSGVLARLLSPGRFAKRVTLVYRPMSAGEAARLLEAQVNAAAFRDAYRRAQKRDESARDTADRLRAQRAAAEEAQGAGVVLLSLHVTVTVLDGDQLAEAVADVESRADQSKIRLRRLYGGQAAAFAAGLPGGLVLPRRGS